MFLVVGHFPLEIFLRINYIFDATSASNRVVFEGQENLC